MDNSQVATILDHRLLQKSMTVRFVGISKAAYDAIKNRADRPTYPEHREVCEGSATCHCCLWHGTDSASTHLPVRKCVSFKSHLSSVQLAHHQERKAEVIWT